MRKATKAILAVVLLLLVTGLTACSLFDSPEKAVRNNLNVYKDKDLDKVLKNLTYEDVFSNDNMGDAKLSDDARAVLSILYKDFDYKVISSDKDGKKAKVKVEITMPDMEKVSKDYKHSAVSYLLEHLDDEDVKNTDGDVIFVLLKDVLEKGRYDKKTITADINVKKDDKWKVSEDETYQNAILGNFMKYYSDVEQISPSEILEQYLSYIKNLKDDEMYELMGLENEKSDAAASAVADQFIKHFNYEVKGESIKDKKAEVELSVTSADLSGVFEAYMKKLRSSISDFTGLTDKQMEDKAQKMILNLIKNNKKTVTKKVTIHMNADNGAIWEPDNLDDIWDAVLEGLTAINKDIK